MENVGCWGFESSQCNQILVPFETNMAPENCWLEDEPFLLRTLSWQVRTASFRDHIIQGFP